MRQFVLNGRRVNSLVKRVQTGSINLASASSGTATILGVDVANSVLVLLGTDETTASLTAAQNILVRLALTNTTTVTATRAGAPGDAMVAYFAVIEFWPGLFRSIQHGAVGPFGSAAASATASINAVDVNRTILLMLGYELGTTSPFEGRYLPYLTLTDKTTITATWGVTVGADGYVGFVACEPH